VRACLFPQAERLSWTAAAARDRVARRDHTITARLVSRETGGLCRTERFLCWPCGCGGHVERVEQLGAYRSLGRLPRGCKAITRLRKSKPPPCDHLGHHSSRLSRAFPPARRDVHARSSVVAGPGRVNMPSACPFAAYSMLRGLTCNGWPCWWTHLALLIRANPFFTSNGTVAQRQSRPSRIAHKCQCPPSRHHAAGSVLC